MSEKTTPRRKGGNGAGSERMLAAHDKQLRALQLRRGGATYDQIAQAVGYADASGALKAVSAALRLTLEEPAEQVRQLELERLDRIWLRWFARATDAGVPDDVAVRAAELCLKVQKRRSDLLGLDAPRRVEADFVVHGQPVGSAQYVEHLRSLPDDELERLIEEART